MGMLWPARNESLSAEMEGSGRKWEAGGTEIKKQQKEQKHTLKEKLEGDLRGG